MTHATRAAGEGFPQARALRNSARLLDSGVELLAADGWGALSFRAVADRAGLSPRPLRDRYADVPALAAGVWAERCYPAVADALMRVQAAAGLRGDAPSEKACAEILDELAHPSPVMLAAGELLVVSHFEPLLRGAVGGTLGRDVQAWCAPRSGRPSRAMGARRAYLLCLALGLVLAGRRPGAERYTMAEEAAVLFEALADDRAPVALPPGRTAPFAGNVVFDTGDPLRDALLASTLAEVGEHGYDGATTRRIVEAIGVTEGALFARYSSKLEVFIEATKMHSAQGYQANDEWLRGLAERYGDGIAAAVFMNEGMRPRYARLRALGLEEVRVTWHDPALRDAHAKELDEFAAALLNDEAITSPRRRDPANVHRRFAMGLGIYLLPHLYPGCWRLPYDVITVPVDIALG